MREEQNGVTELGAASELTQGLEGKDVEEIVNFEREEL